MTLFAELVYICPALIRFRKLCDDLLVACRHIFQRLDVSVQPIDSRLVEPSQFLAAVEFNLSLLDQLKLFGCELLFTWLLLFVALRAARVCA